MFDVKEFRSCMIEAMQKEKPIVALTGAGISAASGLPLGSDAYEGIPLSKMMSRRFFVRYPAKFYRWYRHAVQTWSQAEPNPAHLQLSEWKSKVITQNIDGLHQRLAPEDVLEVHGSLRTLVCPRCLQRFPNTYAWNEPVPNCPTCLDILHPDIVFVGEPVRHFSQAVDWTCKAGVFLIIGTALAMKPCRDLAEIAQRQGITTYRIDEDAEQVLCGLANWKQPTSAIPCRKSDRQPPGKPQPNLQK